MVEAQDAALRMKDETDALKRHAALIDVRTAVAAAEKYKNDVDTERALAQEAGEEEGVPIAASESASVWYASAKSALERAESLVKNWSSYNKDENEMYEVDGEVTTNA
jgi:formyltetrahydrofolate synthetase